MLETGREIVLIQELCVQKLKQKHQAKQLLFLMA